MSLSSENQFAHLGKEYDYHQTNYYMMKKISENDYKQGLKSF